MESFQYNDIRRSIGESINEEITYAQLYEKHDVYLSEVFDIEWLSPRLIAPITAIC